MSSPLTQRAFRDTGIQRAKNRHKFLFQTGSFNFFTMMYAHRKAWTFEKCMNGPSGISTARMRNLVKTMAFSIYP